MSRSTLVRGTVAVTAGLTALGLVAATPAAAHTNNMFTYVTYDDQSEQAGFAHYGKTDGSITPLPTTFVPEEVEIQGIEVHGEKGTEVGFEGNPYVLEWNHTTGEIGEYVPVRFADESWVLNEYVGLDTLNDGRTVTIVGYEVGEEPADYRVAIATVDSSTGILTPIVDLTALLTFEGQLTYRLLSLATDPLSGTTYLFLGDPASDSFYLPIDVAAGTVGEPTRFTGEGFEEGDINGTDFDADGTLYFHYADLSEGGDIVLAKIGPVATWPSAPLTTISLAPALQGQISVALLALTIEHTALAATGAELPVAVWVIGGTVAVLAGGLTVAVARNRREAGAV